MQAALQGIHGAADHGTVLTLDTVFDRNQRFRVFGRNAENTRKPHPQNRTGSAQGDRCADTDDITGTDRGRKRCRQRAELGDIAFRVRILGHRQANRLEDILLNEARTDSHKNMRPEQEDNQRPAPQKAVKSIDNTCKTHTFPSISIKIHRTKTGIRIFYIEIPDLTRTTGAVLVQMFPL